MDGNNNTEIDWTKLSTNFIIENALPDMIFCDIGSCKGEFTDLFIKISKFPEKNVYAFDINPNNPHLKNCIFNLIAISDLDGVEVVYSAGNDWMANILGHDDSYTIKNEKICEIKSVRMDTFFKNIKIDFLKMDMEGAELKGILGGVETLKKCSIILIECHLDKDWVKLYDLFEEIGLDFYELSSNKKIERKIEDNHNSVRPYQIYHKK